MRDPERIPKILDVLEEYWRHYSDLRLAQLVCNFFLETKQGSLVSFTEMNNQNEVIKYCDPYHFEDDDLYRLLKEAVDEIKASASPI